jgi:hypothetical protein
VSIYNVFLAGAKDAVHKAKAHFERALASDMSDQVSTSLMLEA